MGDHLVVLHSAVRACAGYSRHEAPSILMDGSSIARDTEHGRAVTAQLTRRQETLEEALEAGFVDHGAPGVRAHYHPGYYGAFVLDPDGHNLEVVCHR